MITREERARELIVALAIEDQWRSKLEHYHTTLTSCDCSDSQFRRVVCKHRLALQMLRENNLEARVAPEKAAHTRPCLQVPRCAHKDGVG